MTIILWKLNIDFPQRTSRCPTSVHTGDVDKSKLGKSLKKVDKKVEKNEEKNEKSKTKIIKKWKKVEKTYFSVADCGPHRGR